MILIYKITNKINGKKYIGKTTLPLEIRWKNHVSTSKYSNTYLYNAIRKYGVNSFEIKKIDSFNDNDTADYLEMFWISVYKSYDSKYGYNMTFGGEGQIPTEETRKKMSLAKKGLKKPPELVARIAASHVGLKRSPETKAKMRRAQLGKTHTEDAKRKMSLSKTGFQFSAERNEKIAAYRTGKPWTFDQRYGVERYFLLKKYNKALLLMTEESLIN